MTTPSRVTCTSNSIKSLWLVAAFMKLIIVFSRTCRPSPLLAPEPRCLTGMQCRLCEFFAVRHSALV